MKSFIGIDVGTTNIKAAVYSSEGEMLAYHSECAQITHPQADWSEFQPQEIWKCVCSCLNSVISTAGSENIVAIGVSSMGEAGIPLDGQGNELYPLIAWYDPRTREQADHLEACVGRKDIYKITGQIPSGKYGIAKLMWIKDNLPQVYSNTRHWLSVEDYIIFRLTGVYATDYSIATRTLAFDINRLEWSGEILNAVGIDPELFPEAFPGGTAVGKVTTQVADEIGLHEGVAVVTGGHDHACASVGVNILEDGVVLDSMGTAEVSMIAVADPVLSDDTYNRFYSIYPHFGDKLYRVLTSNQSCGAGIEWFLANPGKAVAEEADRISANKYTLMEKYAAECASSVDGLFFFPFLRGSVENKNMRGVFFGIKDSHGIGHLSEALIEGIFYELKLQIEGYSQIFGTAFDKLRVVGGISRSDYMMQTKASLSKMPAEVPVNFEAACYGAAILAEIGAGALDLSRISGRYQCARRFNPQPACFNDSAYRQYLKIRRHIKEIYESCY